MKTVSKFWMYKITYVGDLISFTLFLHFYWFFVFLLVYLFHLLWFLVSIMFSLELKCSFASEYFFTLISCLITDSHITAVNHYNLRKFSQSLRRKSICFWGSEDIFSRKGSFKAELLNISSSLFNKFFKFIFFKQQVSESLSHLQNHLLLQCLYC